MLQAGTVINGTYRIEGAVGAGGGGTVYKAYHLRLQKDVVVKRINDNWVNVMDSRKEADIIKNLKHQYLPQAYDFLKIDSGVYTVMDFVPGASLDKYIKKGYKFNQQQIIFWAKQAAEALVYLHKQNPPIIHSDIKPANIMLTPEGNICLIDFNVSLTSTPDSNISATSRGYAAPEQYLNLVPMNEPVPGESFKPVYHFNMASPLDQRSDIYSLGATLYHLMTGQRPPKAPQDKLPEIPLDLQGFDETLINIVNKMTRYDPRERYQSAEELLKDLNNIRRLDKKYVSYKRKKLIVNTVFPIIMVGALLLCVFGYVTMNKENDEKYDQLISEAANYAEKGDYEKAIENYSEAKDMKSGNIEPYYGMLRIYSDQYDFDKVIEYGKDALASHKFEDSSKKQRADFYYILANAYFEQENYDDAVTFYTKTVELSQDNSEYYRDFAIALARNKYVDKAKEMLQTAKELGLETDAIDLVSAEIAFAEEKYDESVGYFKDAIKLSSNQNLTQRACLYLCKAYNFLRRYDDVIDTLKNYESIFNSSRLRVAKTMSAEAYLNKAGNTSDTAVQKEFGQKAADLYKEAEALGVLSKKAKFNFATAYQYADDMRNAQEILNSMMKDYPDDCDVYARLAILEADKQSKLSNNLKNFDRFKEYYDKAIQLNKRNEASGTSGAYIDEMKRIMQDLKDKKWIGE